MLYRVQHITRLQSAIAQSAIAPNSKDISGSYNDISCQAVIEDETNPLPPCLRRRRGCRRHNYHPLYLVLEIPLHRRELPFVTIVTDLGGAHPTWFNEQADKVFIASDAVMRVAFREGLSVAQVCVCVCMRIGRLWKSLW